jgi:hypothetical protein
MNVAVLPMMQSGMQMLSHAKGGMTDPAAK